MKSIVALAAALLLAATAHAASAFFTGNMQYATSSSGKPLVRCQYNALGRMVWATFPASGGCPSSIEVD